MARRRDRVSLSLFLFFSSFTRVAITERADLDTLLLLSEAVFWPKNGTLGIRMSCNRLERAPVAAIQIKPFLVAIACGPNVLYL